MPLPIDAFCSIQWLALNPSQPCSRVAADAIQRRQMPCMLLRMIAFQRIVDIALDPLICKGFPRIETREGNGHF